MTEEVDCSDVSGLVGAGKSAITETVVASAMVNGQWGKRGYFTIDEFEAVDGPRGG